MKRFAYFEFSIRSVEMNNVSRFFPLCETDYIFVFSSCEFSKRRERERGTEREREGERERGREEKENKFDDKRRD